MPEFVSSGRIAGFLKNRDGLFNQKVILRLIREDSAAVWVIDPASGIGLDLLQWQQGQEGQKEGSASPADEEFYYERRMREWIAKDCVDQSPRSVLESLSLSSVQQSLKEQGGKCCVCFRLKDVSGADGIRDLAAFFYQFVLDGLIFLVLHDLTEAISFRKARYAAQQKGLETYQRDRTKISDFLDLMRQDSRSPLHAIGQPASGTGAGESLTPADSASISAMDGYLRKISMSGTYMADVIDDILQMLHLGNGGPGEVPGTVNLRRFLIRVEESVLYKLQEKDLHFLLDASGLSVNEVEADSSFLQELCEKMVDLVISRTVRGGTVELHIESGGTGENAHAAALTLAAVGRGLVPDTPNGSIPVTDSVESLSELMNREAGAWDLGLNLLKYYTNALGGSLSVENVPDLGMRVSVRLVLHLPEEKENQNIVEKYPFQGRRIIIADDNRINRDLTVRLLEKEGCEVLSAEDGKKAFELYQENAAGIDLIMLDIRMPVMDGLECTRKIRASGIPGCETIPIIALTVCAFESDIEKSFDAGMNEHLIKPVEPERLYEVISHYLKAE